jgi:hypothetical protein
MPPHHPQVGCGSGPGWVAAAGAHDLVMTQSDDFNDRTFGVIDPHCNTIALSPQLHFPVPGALLIKAVWYGVSGKCVGSVQMRRYWHTRTCTATDGTFPI